MAGRLAAEQASTTLGEEKLALEASVATANGTIDKAKSDAVGMHAFVDTLAKVEEQYRTVEKHVGKPPKKWHCCLRSVHAPASQRAPGR